MVRLDNGSRTLADGSIEYYGWQYRVYHNGQLQAISADLGADQFKLADGDVILWMFATYDEAFRKVLTKASASFDELNK